jgi:hypothetical protein
MAFPVARISWLICIGYVIIAAGWREVVFWDGFGQLPDHSSWLARQEIHTGLS